MLLLALIACSPQVTVLIPHAEIQRQVATKFPVERGTRETARVQLSEPTLRLPGDDRLEVDLRVSASLPDLTALDVPPAVATGEDDLATRALDVFARGAVAAAQLAAAPRLELSGDLGMAGTLAYAPAEGAFYVTDSELTALALDSQSPEQTATIRAVAQTGAAAVLDRLPVYTLDHDLKQKAAQLLLKEVHATPEGLQITLGP